MSLAASAGYQTADRLSEGLGSCARLVGTNAVRKVGAHTWTSPPNTEFPNILSVHKIFPGSHVCLYLLSSYPLMVSSL